MNLEEKQRLETYAHTRKQERERVLADIPFGKRKTGEQTAVFALATAAHRSLQIFDKCHKPPAFAELAQQCFDESVARVTELCPSTTDSASE